MFLLACWQLHRRVTGFSVPHGGLDISSLLLLLQVLQVWQVLLLLLANEMSMVHDIGRSLVLVIVVAVVVDAVMVELLLLLVGEVQPSGRIQLLACVKRALGCQLVALDLWNGKRTWLCLRTCCRS